MRIKREIDAGKLIKREFILTGLRADDSTKVITDLSRLLKNGDCVKESFCEEVIKRENEFPTGLSSKYVKVAIPHTDSEYVKKSAIAIAVLKKPIKFRQMDDPSRKIQVELVFLLAIKNSKQQLKVVQKMVELFQKPELMLKIKASNSPDEIKNILVNNI